MRIEHENLFVNALQTGINLFTGSGFSKYADDIEGNSLPLGSFLLNEITERYYKKKSTALSLPQMATNIKSKWNEDFMNFLKYRFSVSKYDPAYKNIKKIACDSIFTTNIDNLLEKVFEEDRDIYINPIYLNGPVYDKRAINYYQLHGSISKIESVKFDVFEVTAAYNTEQSKWASLVHQLTIAPNLFIGYSFSDANTIQAFKLAIEEKRLKQSWILLYEQNDEIIEYFHSLNFSIIIGEVKELLDYFSNISIKTKERSDFKLEDVAQEYLVPLKSTIVSRAFEDFILGSDPTWSDIYYPDIQKTHYYTDINNIVVTGKNVLLIGGTACGKTTLLMQLAASYNQKPKLYINNISYEKIMNIINNVGTYELSVFLDNCCMDYRVVDALSRCKNIQLICADREFLYESISNHFVLFEKILIDEITETDTQIIRNSIPASIRSNKIVYQGDRSSKEHTSVFEIIQYNTNKRTFRERIKQLVKETETDYKCAKILTMISYLQANNSIMNMDILVSMLSEDDGLDYATIEAMIKRINSMIIELGIDHPLVQTNQDHFISRSRIFAEEYIKNVDDRILRDAILLIIEKLTAYFIPNLRVFKRTAFDSDYFLRAFPIVKEGEQYYNYIFDIDKNPYALQQCALYLSERHQHRKAFEYIERAKNAQKNINWTIRNTNSLLTFNTNITKEMNTDTINEIKKSMEELVECYKYDARKFFHCKIFARNVIQIQQKGILEDKLEEYRRLAIIWLKEEIMNNPWRNEAKSLISQLENN